MTCEDQSHGKLTNFIRSYQHFDEVFCYFCYISTFSYYLFLFHSSPHPASSAVRGVVQPFTGVGEQGVALVLQVDEVAVGAVDTAWRETAGGVGGDIETTGSGGKDLTTDGEQVTEGAVGSVRATWRPGAAAIGGYLNGIVAWVDADELSLGEETTAHFDDLWHSIMISF